MVDNEMHLSLTVKCCHTGYVDMDRLHAFFSLRRVHKITNNVYLQLTIQRQSACFLIINMGTSDLIHVSTSW